MKKAREYFILHNRCTNHVAAFANKEDSYLVIQGNDDFIHVREVIDPDPQWVTADMCPHLCSSTLCEWCNAKAEARTRLEIINKQNEIIKILREFIEFEIMCDTYGKYDKHSKNCARCKALAAVEKLE